MKDVEGEAEDFEVEGKENPGEDGSRVIPKGSAEALRRYREILKVLID